MLLLRCYLRIQDGNSEEAQSCSKQLSLYLQPFTILRGRFLHYSMVQILYYTPGAGSLHYPRVKILYSTPGAGYLHYPRVKILYSTPGFRFYTLLQGSGAIHYTPWFRFYTLLRVQVIYTTPWFRFYILLQNSGSKHYSRIQVLNTTPGF